MKKDYLRHDQKYWIIDGHIVKASFSTDAKPELLSTIRGILLGETDSHICKNADGCIRIGEDAP